MRLLNWAEAYLEKGRRNKRLNETFDFNHNFDSLYVSWNFFNKKNHLLIGFEFNFWIFLHIGNRNSSTVHSMDFLEIQWLCDQFLVCFTFFKSSKNVICFMSSQHFNIILINDIIPLKYTETDYVFDFF